jgi:hypothetical protein
MMSSRVCMLTRNFSCQGAPGRRLHRGQTQHARFEQIDFGVNSHGGGATGGDFAGVWFFVESPLCHAVPI